MPTGELAVVQILYLGVYVATQALAMRLIALTRSAPPWAHHLLALSKRIHSIYLLRLFNDCWATLFSYAALNLLCSGAWSAAIVLFSAAVSVKMHALLFAPGVLVVCLLYARPQQLAAGVASGVALQAGLAWPFLMHAAGSYLSRAFEFSRVFSYEWTVNWRMVPEDTFLDRRFAAALLLVHAALLVLFAQRCWFKPSGGFLAATRGFLARGQASHRGTPPDPPSVLKVALTANFIGIITARSLHYQFYSWYFHSLPLLLWLSGGANALSYVSMAVIELCWNVFPATAASSAILLLHHLGLLYSLWAGCSLLHGSESERATKRQ